MRHSIRFRLFIYMTFSILAFALLLLCTNLFYAEKYYIRHKKNSLIKSSQAISKLISAANTKEDFKNENLIYNLNRLEKNMGGTIAIGTIKGEIYYPTYNNRDIPVRPIPNKNPFFRLEEAGENLKQLPRDYRPMPRRKVKDWERHNENSFFVIMEDPNLKIETLRYQVNLDNGLVLLIWVPMTEISESVVISSRLIAIIGGVFLIIMGLWALYFSGRFTKPITQINRVTKKMAQLNFNERLDIKGKDEIAQQSLSINHLSGSLEQAIRELNERNQKLEQDIDRERALDKMRRDFISNVSHELKTPVFLIQGYAEGLRTNVANNPEKRNFYCDVIMDEAEKMNVLIKDLLNLSQIESGMFSIEKSEFNLTDLIQEALKKFQPILEEKNIHVETQMEDNLFVYADPVRIEQVIVNFLNNAVDHVDHHKLIKIWVEKGPEKARVLVYNSGVHIPQEEQENIWLSFYKVDQARTREYGGTGLGLAIVKAIQQAHQNDYGVDNAEGGVVFWFDVDIL